MKMIRVIGLSIVVACSLAAGAADPIANVLPCGKVGTVGGLGAGTDLTKYSVDTAKFPNAVCNDGSPAIFYYAPSTGQQDRNKWLIFLQGGGSCTSGQKCAERWCHVDTNYGMDKMSSTLAKPQIRGNGFLAPEARNRFSTWNRVLIYYCSSDQWFGAKTSTATASSANSTVEFEIQFRGSQIVEGVLDTLRNATPGGRRRISRHDVQSDGDAWPDLDAATHVIFAGASGGGNGVKNNADRVGAKLRTTNPGLQDYRVIIDASFTFETTNLDYTKTTMCADNPAGCSYASFYQGVSTAVDKNFHGGRGDESCITYHASREPGSEWVCTDKDHVLLHHITTPFFVHQDLQDPQVGGDGFVDLGLGTPVDFAQGVEAALRNFPPAEEPRGAEPGRFAPQCMTHEAFTNNSDVFNLEVNGITWHDTVWNWWTHAQPQSSIQAFSGTPGKVPGCPPD